MSRWKLFENQYTKKTIVCTELHLAKDLSQNLSWRYCAIHFTRFIVWFLPVRCTCLRFRNF